MTEEHDFGDRLRQIDQIAVSPHMGEFVRQDRLKLVYW